MIQEDGSAADRSAIRGQRIRRITALVVLAALVVGYVFRKPWFEHNFGVVDPGRVYRSAQPRDELVSVIRHRAVGSVLNLRGGSPKDSWYVDEIRTCRQEHVDFYDLPMSATQRPSRGEILRILDLFERCRYPLLIHCKSGSDRTGLAAALYLLCIRGLDPEAARKAFAFEHGHIPILGTQRLHEPFVEYREWLATRKLEHRPERFRTWVEQVYRSEDPPGPAIAVKPGTREPRFEELLFPKDDARSETRLR